MGRACEITKPLDVKNLSAFFNKSIEIYLKVCYTIMAEYRQNANYEEINGVETEVNPPKEENHGNTRLPFGLCKRYGISLPDSATPRDAWNALKGKGITPNKVYQQLKQKNNTKDAVVVEKINNIVNSNAVQKLPKTTQEALKKTLGKMPAKSVEIVEKYINEVNYFANGRGSYSRNKSITFGYNSKGTNLDAELGFNFGATEFFHEYGHFVDNVVGYNKTKTYFGKGSFESDNINSKDDALYAFNEIMAIGDSSVAKIKSFDRLKREQKQAFYKGMSSLTGKKNLREYKSASDFGLIREPYIPTYTPERARELFGEYGYENAIKLWQRYDNDYKAWQEAEKNGKNAEAYKKAKDWNDTREKYNAPIEAQLERYGFLTDFFGLYTNDRISPMKNGYWGHSGSYNKSRSYQHEAFAEYFSAKMTNDTKTIDIIKKFLPNTYNKFEEIFNKL